jgi:hypothetical protein
MRPLFEPSLLNDTFGDPGLYVDFRDARARRTAPRVRVRPRRTHWLRH